MKRYLLFVLLLVAVGCSGPGPGQGPDAGQGDLDFPDVDETPSGPSVEAYFTWPSPGQADRTLENLFIEKIGDTPAGAEVRGAFFSFSLTSVADALAEARERGVDVQIVLGNTNQAGSGQEYSAVGALRAGLGDDLTICSEGASRGGCLGENLQHNKFLIISELENGQEHVVIQSSGNVTSFQQHQYDNLVVISGDEGLYRGFETYFLDLQADQRNPDYHHVAQGDSPTTAYFSPYSQGDPVEEDLNAIECEEGDEIYLAMAFFTDARRPIALRLNELDQEGCEVRVLLRWSDIDSPGQRIISLLRSGSIDFGYFPQAEEIQLHHKFLIYRAHRAGESDPVAVVWTGSHNYTRSALYENDEALLRIEDEALFDAFREHWLEMRERAETRWP